jgi:hypothetical protein
MSTQYRLVQSGKTASGGCSASQGSSEPVAPQIALIVCIVVIEWLKLLLRIREVSGSNLGPETDYPYAI